jgi:hypothetical protein
MTLALQTLVAKPSTMAAPERRFRDQSGDEYPAPE